MDGCDEIARDANAVPESVSRLSVGMLVWAPTDAAPSFGHARVTSFFAAEEGGVTLYRAVGQEEAAEIAAAGTYRIAGKSARSGKYFYPTGSRLTRSWHAVGLRR
jgi:hypothetical protein